MDATQFFLLRLGIKRILGDAQSALLRAIQLNERQTGGSRLVGANSSRIIELLATFNGAALSSLALNLSRFHSAMKLVT